MPDAVSMFMSGDMTYADEDAQNTAFTFNWVIDSQNRIRLYLDTSFGGSGTHRFQKAKDGAYMTVSGTPDYYEPGVGVPFSIGARMAQNFINGCMDGVTLSINQSDEPLVDLSATDIGLVSKGFGHISQFALFSKDIGDTKLAELTA